MTGWVPLYVPNVGEMGQNMMSKLPHMQYGGSVVLRSREGSGQSLPTGSFPGTVQAW